MNIFRSILKGLGIRSGARSHHLLVFQKATIAKILDIGKLHFLSQRYLRQSIRLRNLATQNGKYCVQHNKISLKTQQKVSVRCVFEIHTRCVCEVMQLIDLICKMVPGGGFEPSTRGFSVHWSILKSISYIYVSRGFNSPSQQSV